MNKIVVLVIAVCLLAIVSCSSTKVTSGTGEGTQGQSQQGQMTYPPANPQPVIDPLKDPNNILFKRSSYFDFDKFVIKPEDQAMISAHAKYLIAHPDAIITVQGNCDERGTQKYNLKLGMKRAVAVKQMMTRLGVPDKQINVISFGKDKPDSPGHNEQAWAANRRADIVYANEKKVSFYSTMRYLTTR